MKKTIIAASFSVLLYGCNWSSDSTIDQTMHQPNMPETPHHSIEVTKFCYHAQCPVGSTNQATGKQNPEIGHSRYSFAFNQYTRFSDWVAYRVSKDTIGSCKLKSTGRRAEYIPDPQMTKIGLDTLEKIEITDGIGGTIINRGHQANCANISKGSDDIKQESNYTSNITPQYAGLNQGPWVTLEGAVGNEAKKTDDGLYVMTGPIYNNFSSDQTDLYTQDILYKLPYFKKHPDDDDISYIMPSGYWKIIIKDTDKGPKVAAFIMPQSGTFTKGIKGNKAKLNYVCVKYSTTIADIQDRTKFNFKLSDDGTNWLCENNDSFRM